jgi:hypothetical protein
MPIRLAKEPPGTFQAAAKALTRERRDPTDGVRSMAGGSLPLESAAAHPVFDLDLLDVAKGAGLDAARPSAWRFLALEGGQPVAAAEVPSTAAGGGAPRAQVNTGTLVAGTFAAIRKAEDLPEVRQGSYELRVLRIPALYVLAVWLKNDDAAGEDILFPVSPAPAGIHADRAYPPGELLDELRQPARERLGADDLPYRG